MKPYLADTFKPGRNQTLDEAVQPFLDDHDHAIEQKVDGHRVLVHVDAPDGKTKVTFLGRDGTPKANAVPRNIRDQFMRIDAGDWWFDGELVDDVLWLFDFPRAEVTPGTGLYPHDPYRIRRQVLEGFHAQWQPDPCVRLLPNAVTPHDKNALYQRMRDQHAEGVMLKTLDGRYNTSGARTRDLRKVKFINTIDCVVTRTGVDGKENAELSINGVKIGKCSLIGKPPVKVGDVVEVIYLYATDDDRLYQPRLLRVRTDKRAHECTRDQMVYTSKEVWPG